MLRRAWPPLLLLVGVTFRHVRGAQDEKIDMKGACAVVYKEQKWLAEDQLNNWDYKIRVEPWTVFGHVTVKLHGVNMEIQNIYGAAGTPGGSQVTVQLNAVDH